MTSVHSKRRSAFTLVEEMVVISILAVTVIGTSAYEYGASLDARKADLNSTAVRTALLLCEGWSGSGGDTLFNPVDIFSPDLDIKAGTGPEFPGGFTKLGSYVIIIEGGHYYATLSWKDTGTGLKALNVIVKWDQTNHHTTTLGDADKTYQLTTYAKKSV